MSSLRALRRSQRARAWHLAHVGRSESDSAPQGQRRPVKQGVNRVSRRVPAVGGKVRITAYRLLTLMISALRC
jgi:hypothetical protein